MLKKSITFILPLIITLSLNAQSEKENKIHAFSGKWAFTLEGGFTLGYTDYLRIKPAGSLRGAVEYFLPTTTRNIFGLKLYAGGQQVAGEDDRTSINTKDGLREIPPAFRTDMYILGLAGSYSLSFEDKNFPFIQMGFSNIWFNPKDEDGIRLKGNADKLYNKSLLVFDAHLGSRFLLSDIASLNVSVGAHFTSSDYLDDIATGNKSDIYYSVLLGISVSPFKPGDRDQDGILDVYDACPDEAEDFDGFEDDDGCPDYDNDYDGIPDSLDLCPNEPEDFDGFEDLDGCPDPDNDGDGIPDHLDLCPNEPEDFDGFQDNDGCPDYDNDNDGIPDSLDLCPNEPEDFNGFEDQDGCPDQLTIVTVNQIRIFGAEIFYNGTSTIKPEGVTRLTEALETIKLEPESKWRIEGHMDSQGSEQFIRTMSYERAEAVYRFFISKGLSVNRLSVYGMSDNFPIADNTNEEGRRKNRRIEIIREK